MNLDTDNMSTPCRSEVLYGVVGSCKDCHAQKCVCLCHNGIPPVCDCAEKEADEKQLALLEQEAYWRGRLLPELREQIAQEIEKLDYDLGVHDGDLTLDRDDVLQAIRGEK